MNRPTSKQKGEPISYFLAIYDAAGNLIAPDSTPSVEYFQAGNSPGFPSGSLNVSPTTETGIFTVTGVFIGEDVGEFFSLIETAVISGETKKNVFTLSIDFSETDLLSAIYGTDITGFNLNGSAGLMLNNINLTTVTKMLGMLEQDGSPTEWRWTAASLAEAPSGGGGGGDATLANQQTIIANLATKSSQASVDQVDSTLASVQSDLATKSSQASVDLLQTETSSVLAISNKLDGTLQNDGLGGNQFTVKALENAPSGGGGGGDATLANQQTIIAAVGALKDFDPANDVVAQVSSVAQVTTNLDMRGTDGANQVSPDNAGIANTLAAVGALKDFDPANDVVAQVASVSQVTTNLDMRGTDGANQVAPDNAGIQGANDALAEVAKLNVEYVVTNQAGDTMNVTKTEA